MFSNLKKKKYWLLTLLKLARSLTIRLWIVASICSKSPRKENLTLNVTHDWDD